MSKRFTMADVERLQQEGKIRGYKVIGKQGKREVKKQRGLPKQDPDGVRYIKRVLDDAGVAYVTEYLFHDVRKFRFDVAIPKLMVAIEYEGLVATGKKGGHQTKAGYTNNCTKYNLAAEMGWRVYRYTSRNYRDFKIELIQ